MVEQGTNGTVLRDLGSGNGTYIENRRVLEYKLSHGDVIRMGQQEIRFTVGEAEGGIANAPTSVPSEKQGESGVRFQEKEEGRVQSSSAANVYETFFQAPDMAVTQEQLRETQERLQAVYAATALITSETDLNKVFSKVMDKIFELVPAHNGVILLKDKKSGELVTEFVKSGVDKAEVTVSSTIVNRASDKGEAVITYDAAGDDRFEAGASIISQNISSAMCVPLLHQGECLGVLYLDTHGTTNAFVQGDLELLVALAGSSAIAIKNAQYMHDLEQSYQDNLLTLVNAIEMRDHYTVGHTWRVTNFSIEIAREMGWDDEQLKQVYMGGVLHDVGKIAIPDAILGKASRLTEEEFAQMKVHPERGARLLGDVEILQQYIPYCLSHHERYDGKGYPSGLKGEEIPLEARLLSVVDAYDAMSTNRPYRKRLTQDEVKAELKRNSGMQHDPQFVEAFLRMLEKKELRQVAAKTPGTPA